VLHQQRLAVGHDPAAAALPVPRQALQRLQGRALPRPGHRPQRLPLRPGEQHLAGVIGDGPAQAGQDGVERVGQRRAVADALADLAERRQGAGGIGAVGGAHPGGVAQDDYLVTALPRQGIRGRLHPPLANL